MQVLIPHRTDVKIESMASSKDYLVVFQRIKGLQVSQQFNTAHAPSGPVPSPDRAQRKPTVFINSMLLAC